MQLKRKTHELPWQFEEMCMGIWHAGTTGMESMTPSQQERRGEYLNERGMCHGSFRRM